MTSEAFVSWGFGTAGSMMTTSGINEDAGTSLGVELVVVESPSTSMEIGRGVEGVDVKTLG